MPVDASLRELVRRVGAFHITNPKMKRSQRAIEEAIERGDAGDAAHAQYLAAVRAYFDSFDREARAQLRDVDKRLERVNQVQFNLLAERGVAVKRIEATSEVLEALNALEGSAR
jgi:hypothetical protein